jgi:hypothetical protein
MEQRSQELQLVVAFSTGIAGWFDAKLGAAAFLIAGVAVFIGLLWLASKLE